MFGTRPVALSLLLHGKPGTENQGALGTGEAFRVPTRDLVTLGLVEQLLDQYPLWEEVEHG